MIVTIHRQVVTRIPRFSVSHDHPITWLLHIRGAQPEDAGRYMCQVNSDPMVSQQGAVTVVGQSHFQLNRAQLDKLVKRFNPHHSSLFNILSFF